MISTLPAGCQPVPQQGDRIRVWACQDGYVDRAKARFARIEQIKRFSVLDHDPSQDDGELTPTMKVKRAAVAARYAERIDALYAW